MAGDRHPLDPVELVTGPDVLGAAAPLLVGLPVGLAAGRLARWVAVVDRQRHGGTGPARAPLIEATTAAIVVAAIARFGLTVEILPTLVVVTAMVATGSTDLRSHRIPDRIVFPSLAATAVSIGGIAIVIGEPDRIWSAAGGAICFGAILLAVHLLVPDGLGRGDVKLGLLLGAAIGWHRPPSLLVIEPVVWSLLVASVLGLSLAVARHRLASPGAVASLRHQRVPFGPALSAATIGVVGLADLVAR